MSFDRARWAHLYPFESHWFDLDGVAMHYLDEGTGDPVVMVHGNPTWSFYYRELVTALSATHRCIVPDHVGCGLSDKPDDARYPYRLVRRIDDLERLLESCGVTGNVTLVVHDWGGAIGFGWAARHPERVRRIIVLNTGAFRLPAAKPFPWPLRLIRETALGAILVRGFNAFALTAAWTCTEKRLRGELRRAYRSPYDSWGNRIATLRFVEDIPLRPGDPSWDDLMVVEAGLEQFRDRPALICWGLRDWVFDRHFLKEWRRRLPEADVHAWEDAGHYILEDRREEIVSLVLAFLGVERKAEGGGA